MRPQSAKAKGRRHQQLIVQSILSTFVELSEDDVRSRSMGAAGEDIMLSAAARRLLNFSFEAKNVERLNVWDAFRQAEANAEAPACPAVVMKKNHTPPLCVLRWSDFLALARRASRDPGGAESDAARLRRIADLLEGHDRRRVASSSHENRGAQHVVEDRDQHEGDQPHGELAVAAALLAHAPDEGVEAESREGDGEDDKQA